MDIKYLAVLILAFYCGSSVQGLAIEVSHNVTAFMGSPATLSCKYTSNDITTAVLIRWDKYSDDGESLTPVAVRRTPSGKAEFKKKNGGHRYDDHAELKSEYIASGENYVTLNLVIHALECEDIGKFKCSVIDTEVTGSISDDADLNIEVHPNTPAFTTEELQVSLNTTFSLTCEAEVGTPPHVITFSYRAPGTNVYTLVQEGVETEVTPIPDQCTNKATSSLELTMTEDLDNSQYMCSLAEAMLGEDGTPKNFDEIMLKVYRETTTTTTTTTQAPVISPKHNPVEEDVNSAPGVHTSLSALLCGLLVAFMPVMMGTSS